MRCTCCIIPNDVLRRLAQDTDLDADVRQALTRTAILGTEFRKMREQARELTGISQSVSLAFATLAAVPAVTVYTCNQTQSLPGAPIPNPGASTDGSAKRAHDQTEAVAKFYKAVFNRNSIDNAGMTMMSSIHFGVKYNNAMWNGSQMLYGDGDSQIFIDFTGGNDVIGHELTHGVTQHTLQLAYANEAGGLNESLSDVFGSMFRQWQAGDAVTAADWLIGKDIMGPTAIARGFTCLRDMANPAASHALAPQPTTYSQYQPGMDPHYSSGIPNLAFYTFAMAVGGKSWEKAGQIWYSAMINGGAAPNLTMRQFATRTHQAATHLYPGDAALDAKLKQAWAHVGV